MLTAPRYLVQLTEDTTFGKLLIQLKSWNLRLASEEEIASDSSPLFICKREGEEIVESFKPSSGGHPERIWTMNSSDYELIPKGTVIFVRMV